MDRVRRNPMRSGLIGLGVVGAAGPLAYANQPAIQDQNSHEYRMDAAVNPPANDLAVSRAWQETDQREQMIESKVSEYAKYGVSRELAEDIYDIAKQNAIDPEVAFGLVRAESSFKNSSTSPVGAVGLTQLMPATAQDVEPGVSRGDLRNPQTNLRIGFKYLNRLLDKYNGNEDLALLAYNRGPGTVDRALKRGQNPDNGYAKFVRGEANHGHTLYTR